LYKDINVFSKGTYCKGQVGWTACRFQLYSIWKMTLVNYASSHTLTSMERLKILITETHTYKYDQASM
jgi:hypothetical protein